MNMDTFVEDCLAVLSSRAVAPVAARGWPVGTLVHNRRNGRRGAISWSQGHRCAVEFSDGAVWHTTWTTVIENYRKV